MDTTGTNDLALAHLRLVLVCFTCHTVVPLSRMVCTSCRKFFPASISFLSFFVDNRMSFELFSERMCVRSVPSEQDEVAWTLREINKASKRRKKQQFLEEHMQQFGAHTNDGADGSQIVRAMRHFCERGIYGICEECFGLERRLLNEKDLTISQPPSIPQCTV